MLCYLCPTRDPLRADATTLFLIFLYNTGARAEEASDLNVSSVTLAKSKSESTIPLVTIVGKGNKTRRCPLWDNVCAILKTIINDRKPDEPLFLKPLRPTYNPIWNIRSGESVCSKTGTTVPFRKGQES